MKFHIFNTELFRFLNKFKYIPVTKVIAVISMQFNTDLESMTTQKVHFTANSQNCLKACMQDDIIFIYNYDVDSRPFHKKISRLDILLGDTVLTYGSHPSNISSAIISGNRLYTGMNHASIIENYRDIQTSNKLSIGLLASKPCITINTVRNNYSYHISSTPTFYAVHTFGISDTEMRNLETKLGIVIHNCVKDESVPIRDVINFKANLNTYSGGEQSC